MTATVSTRRPLDNHVLYARVDSQDEAQRKLQEAERRGGRGYIEREGVKWKVWVQWGKANSSIYDYEEARRAGKKRAAEFPGVSIARESVNEQFEIWWKYEGSSDLVEPKDKPGNRKVYMASWFKKRNPESSAADLSESFHGSSVKEVIEISEAVNEHEWLMIAGELVELVAITPTGFEASFCFNGYDKTSSNPWFGRKKETKGYSQFRSAWTVRDARIEAYQAGKVSGDTGRFKKWLADEGLDGRSKPLITSLRSDYGRGVNGLKPIVDKYKIAMQAADSWLARHNPESDAVFLCFSEDGRQMYPVGGDQKIDLDAIKMNGDKWFRDLMVIGELKEVTYRTKKKFDKFQLTDYYHELGEESLKKDKKSKGARPTLLFDTMNSTLSVAGGHYRIAPDKLWLGMSPGIEN